MSKNKLLIILCLIIIIKSSNAFGLDVLNYHLSIEPNIQEAYLKGKVIIQFKTNETEQRILLNSGNLQITQVLGKSVESYKVQDAQLVIELNEKAIKEHEVSIQYEGKPKRGLYFNSELNQAYTAYFTSEWMVCHETPSDKASIQIEILVPKELQCIANGELRDTKVLDSKTLYQWNQNHETPAYTYGFVVGSFNTFEMDEQGIIINNLSSKHNQNELNQIFGKTPEMLAFFEEKSGIKYENSSYHQILIGNYYQEMAGFSVLKKNYGNLVLKDSTETNLISHELAHQWWGNRITCKSWNHFWLNEGMATFMSAAYNEYRFGKEKYESDINSYFKAYHDVKKRGNDKPLVFKGWLNPSSDDRTLVYFKGAYVIHLLRQELGEELFWKGIKYFSQTYFDQSVITEDFKKSFEEVAKRDLTNFFNEWVFGI